MIEKVGTFDKLDKSIKKSNKKIIIFGAGMIGTVTTCAILEEYHLDNRIMFFVDNNIKNCGNTIEVLNRQIPVCSVDDLNHIGDGYVILLAISRFSEVLCQLNSMQNLRDIECYIIPMMCVENYKISEKNIIKQTSDKIIIPKIINYMWLGKKKIPQVLQYCIDSWKKYCPDYEIKCWNEDNYDIEKNLYMKQAYEKGMYGFVPDYARIDILYNCGGIYLDTDVELIKNLDDMLYQEAFCCVEKWQTINLGGGSGAVKGNQAIGKLLQMRENLTFIDEKGNQNKATCGVYDTRTMQKYGYCLNGKLQNVMGMNIYPFEVFHPYDYMSGRIQNSLNTHGIHHFNGGWLDAETKAANKNVSDNFERLLTKAKGNG